MEHAEETLASLVAASLKARNTTAFAAENAAGLPEDAIRSILRGGKKSGTTLNRAKAVCDALGIEFYIGKKRDGDSDRTIRADAAAYSQIPVHDAALSAGPGHLNGDTSIIDHLAFRNEWLTGAGISPNHARVARVRGDSMAPAISAGDLVLIDTTKSLSDVPRRAPKDRRPAPIFAFIQDGEARVKRVERTTDRSIVLLSDNPAFPPEVIDPAVVDFKLLGQVVWSGHVWR